MIGTTSEHNYVPLSARSRRQEILDLVESEIDKLSKSFADHGWSVTRLDGYYSRDICCSDDLYATKDGKTVSFRFETGFEDRTTIEDGVDKFYSFGAFIAGERAQTTQEFYNAKCDEILDREIKCLTDLGFRTSRRERNSMGIGCHSRDEVFLDPPSGNLRNICVSVCWIITLGGPSVRITAEHFATKEKMIFHSTKQLLRAVFP